MAVLAVHERCVRHPAFCSPQLCGDIGTDIAHREASEVFPLGDGEVMTVGLDQWDERDEQDRQVVHGPQVVLTATALGMYLHADEADALAALLHETARRARTREARP